MPPISQIKTITTHPGVYLFKDGQANILYIGKAKSLRSRVQSYFRPHARLAPNKQRLVKKISAIETITCDTETEALILEVNLIRQHQPPYNVILRDDKFFLFIKITTNEPLPRVFTVRRIKKDGARYFGPYSSAASVRNTLKLLRRIFPHRNEKDDPREYIFPHPLFNIIQVTAGTAANITGSREPQRDPPLAGKAKLSAKPEKHPSRRESSQQYQDNITNIIRFLRGNRKNITSALRAGMEKASQTKQYEQAAIFRDQLRAIERLEGSQKVYLPRRENFDAISIARDKNMSAANLFQVRQGKLLGKNTFLLKHRWAATPQDILRQFILQYYSVAQDVPSLILVPHHPIDQGIISNWVNTQRPPTFLSPQRGKKKQLLNLGTLNARQVLNQETATSTDKSKLNRALHELAISLNTTRPLRHVETYDISNIQGRLATGSLVVFTNGRPDKSRYKKFRIQLGETPNDYTMLKEVLTRRFSRRHRGWPLPDLILIDGGRGQLSAARSTLTQLKVSVPIAAIAKHEETIFTYNRNNRPAGQSRPNQPAKEIRLAYDSTALFLVQRMRDEAHRFTLAYHQLLRSKQQKKSFLDEIPGIGPKTKQKLFRRFGSLKAIRAASSQEIVSTIGPAKTKTLRDWL